MNFSKSDIGDYKCVARNHGGIENENVIRLIRPEGIFYYISVFITKPKKLYFLVNKTGLNNYFSIILDDVCRIYTTTMHKSNNCKSPDGANCQPVCTEKDKTIQFAMSVRTKCNISW